MIWHLGKNNQLHDRDYFAGNSVEGNLGSHRITHSTQVNKYFTAMKKAIRLGKTIERRLARHMKSIFHSAWYW